MNSFYGGPNGQSFEIKKIFKNKCEMDKDLSLSWQSPIGVSDYVIISYGLPGKREDGQPEDTDEFKANQDLDLEEFGHTYNATLWQKIYTENNQQKIDELTGIEVFYIAGNYGLGYRLIASMSGNTPRFTFNTVELPPNSPPRLEINNSSIDRPIITAYLPKSQILALKSTTKLHANQDPTVQVDSSDVYKPLLHFSLPRAQVITLQNEGPLNADQDPILKWDTTTNGTSTDPANPNGIDRPILKISLPKSQVVSMGTNTWVNAGQDPRVIWNNDNINRPVISFELPKSQKLKLKNLPLLNAGQAPVITYDDTTNVNEPVLGFQLPQSQVFQQAVVHNQEADDDPRVVINYDNINKPVPHFYLPVSQVMDQPESNIINPIDNPSVNLAGTVNNPKLIFSLPRAAKFYYGELLGERSARNYTLSTSDVQGYKIGDYYININTGFIYSVTNKESNNVTFTYQACLSAPVPTINSASVNPYTEAGEKVNPQVSSSFANDTEKTGWTLNFNLPRLPNFSVDDSEFVGSAEKGDVTVAPNKKDNVNFHFKLPNGSRMFAGIIVEGEGSYDVFDAIVGDALPGDLYLNTKTGTVYKLDIAGVWEYQNEGLRGPAGKALNIVRDYSIDVRDGIYQDNLADGVTFITSNYNPPGGYSPEELIAITFINEKGEDISYWYFYTEEKKWGRVQLTGEAMSLLLNSYAPSPDKNNDIINNKTYSVDYINRLIGGNLSSDTMNRTTFSKDQMYALTSWGTFNDAINGNWWSDIGSSNNTLSAEEVIGLLSWGNLGTLVEII